VQGRRADGASDAVPRVVTPEQAGRATQVGLAGPERRAPLSGAPHRGAESPALHVVREAIISCDRCPRLRSYCTEIARTKRRAYKDDVYWGRPVPGFGDPDARLLIIGLAPAAHGANRTGRRR